MDTNSISLCLRRIFLINYCEEVEAKILFLFSQYKNLKARKQWKERM